MQSTERKLNFCIFALEYKYQSLNRSFNEKKKLKKKLHQNWESVSSLNIWILSGWEVNYESHTHGINHTMYSKWDACCMWNVRWSVDFIARYEWYKVAVGKDGYDRINEILLRGDISSDANCLPNGFMLQRVRDRRSRDCHCFAAQNQLIRISFWLKFVYVRIENVTYLTYLIYLPIKTICIYSFVFSEKGKKQAIAQRYTTPDPCIKTIVMALICFSNTCMDFFHYPNTLRIISFQVFRLKCMRRYNIRFLWYLNMHDTTFSLMQW